MSIWQWPGMIASIPASAQITLGEGNTPIVRSRHLGRLVGLPNLYFKMEQSNPSGSYKDRFAAAAISFMVSQGKTKCIATSSGNTGAALAAYCAAAGIECRIAIVEAAPFGKLKQMLAYGAQIARVRDFGTDAGVTERVFAQLQQLGTRPDSSLQISAYRYSAAGMSGVQTLSYELAGQLELPIDHVFCPAGGGGLCVAVARGFGELVRRGELTAPPAVECVQPLGNDTIAGPLRDGSTQARPVACTTKISGLQVASVIDGDAAIQACRASGGSGHVVTDEEVWDAQRRMARTEGIFTEPAGAVAVAGALRAVAERRIDPQATVVCLVTGSGFKDETAVDRLIAGLECPLIDERRVAEL